MKVIHILNHFLPDHIAGTEVYAYNLGKELKKEKVEVLYLIPNYGKQTNDEYDFDGFRVIKYSEPSLVDRSLKMGKRKPDGLPFFLRILQEEKSDIVHFHEIAGSNGITFSHVAEAKKLGCKVVMTFHLGNYTATTEDRDTPLDIFDTRNASTHFYRNKGFGNLAIQFIYPLAQLVSFFKMDVSSLGKLGTALSVPQIIRQKRNDFLQLVENCDAAVTIAKWYYKALQEILNHSPKLFFIEQGICYEKLNTMHQKKSDKIKLIFVGRISHFKGIKLLIAAVTALPYDKLQLDIYGDSGEDDTYISECKKMAEGKSNIQFLGRLSPAEVIPTMSTYDALVLNSTVHEMSPLVIREAFAAGIPVLASNVFGNAEQITDGENGWLFKFKSEQDLQTKLQTLIDHPILIEKAKKHIPPVRTFTKVAEEYVELYQKILQGF